VRPIVLNGEVWRVVTASPDDPLLVDRTNTLRLATTDPVSHTIRISSEVKPPLLDRVLLHEVAHAITVSYGLLGNLHNILPKSLWIPVEEIIAQIVENFSIEAAIISSESLARPLCVRGYCLGGVDDVQRRF